MPGLLLLSSALLAATPAESVVCAVGRVALADLLAPTPRNPALDPKSPNGPILIGRSRNPENPTLFDVCPNLAKLVPAPWRLVNEAEITGVEDNGHNIPPPSTWIEPPKISADGRHASVNFGAGGLFPWIEHRNYRRYGHHWRARGAAMTDVVT